MSALHYVTCAVHMKLVGHVEQVQLISKMSDKGLFHCLAKISMYKHSVHPSFEGPPLANLRLWDYWGGLGLWYLTPCLKLGLQKLVLTLGFTHTT